MSLGKVKSAVAVCALTMGISGVANADIAQEIATTKTTVETCSKQGRDICVVTALTGILTSIDHLDYIFVNEPDTLANMVTSFEKSSFSVASEGRPTFRKFLAENAIWTLDFYFERFDARVNPNYSYEGVRHFFAAHQLLRADACDELNNAPCAASAMWNVKNAQNEELWPQIVERFQMQDRFVEDVPNRLFAAYQDQI